MTLKKPALLPEDLWEELSSPLQVVISAMVTHYEQHIAALEAQVGLPVVTDTAAELRNEEKRG